MLETASRLRHGIVVPLVIAVGYLLFSGCWIIVTDYAFATVITSRTNGMQLQTLKGLGFVLVTAVLLFVVLRLLFLRMLRREARIRQTRDRLELAMESAGEAMWVWNLPEDRVEWSERMFHTLRMAPEEFDNRVATAAGLVHPDDLPLIQDRVRRHLEGKAELYLSQHRMRRNDGIWIWVQSCGKVVRRDAQGNPLLLMGTWRDISDQKRIESELYSTASRLQNTLAALDDAVLVVDMCQRRFIDANQATREIFGYDPEELVGGGTEVIHLDESHYRDFLDLIAPSLEQKGSFRGQYRLRRRSGESFHSEISIRALYPEKGWRAGVVGVVRDTEEQHRAMRQIEKNEAWLKEAEAIANLGVWEFDVARDRLAWSDHVFRMFQVEKEEFGANYHAFLQQVHPEDRAMMRQVHQDALESEGLIDVEHRVLLPDGSVRWMQERGRVVRDSAGQPITILGTVLDITQRKRVEQHLQASREQLEQRVAVRTAELQSKTEELEAFAHTVSHDLRAPLRAIEGFAMALNEDYEAVFDDEGRAYLKHIVDSAARMDALIQDLLAYSRIGRIEWRLGPVPLAEVLHRCLNELKGERESKGATIELQGEFPVIWGHAATVGQIATNLLSNAMKFSAPGVPPSVKVWVECYGDSATLWIQDNGIGIPGEYQEKIFDIFERLHGIESYPGTGIGLAIVSRAAERLGGRCGVVSALGHGSRFWVEFHLAKD